jgi:hypothetical protein
MKCGETEEKGSMTALIQDLGHGPVFTVTRITVYDVLD